MRGQLSLEFLIIFFLLTTYLSVVFTLFSSTKASLEQAVDKKVEQRISSWTNFIFQRPKGTEIQLELNPFPNRFVGIRCGENLIITTPSKITTIDIASNCESLNITGKSCILIKRIDGGVQVSSC
ncbi:MAG: hypothetical protein GOV01_00075 [Candidatus Altiarchaeota archaeon]|nr:hypothetical protein [Candidatus Altiarchaeota archaeon]